MEMLNEDGRPWYREPWPWLLMIGPATAVAAGTVTIWLAITTADGVVEDDYYKSGLEINQVLERDRNALQQEIRAQIMAGDGEHTLRLSLQGNDRLTPPAALKLKVMHPTQSGHDQVILMQRVGSSGYYEGVLKGLEGARWRLALEDDAGTWRLTGSWRFPRDRAVSLPAKVQGPMTGR